MKMMSRRRRCRDEPGLRLRSSPALMRSSLRGNLGSVWRPHLLPRGRAPPLAASNSAEPGLSTLASLLARTAVTGHVRVTDGNGACPHVEHLAALVRQQLVGQLEHAATFVDDAVAASFLLPLPSSSSSMQRL